MTIVTEMNIYSLQTTIFIDIVIHFIKFKYVPSPSTQQTYFDAATIFFVKLETVFTTILVVTFW